MLLVHKSASLSRCISSLHAALQVYMASSGSKKYHWTDVQLYALGLAGQNASNQDKTTDVQLVHDIQAYESARKAALGELMLGRPQLLLCFGEVDVLAEVMHVDVLEGMVHERADALLT